MLLSDCSFYTCEAQMINRSNGADIVRVLWMIFTIRVAKSGCGIGWEKKIKMFRRRS